MAKNIFKEIIIILLLTLAIILLLGVMLYDYVPMNKVIPETVTYTASEEVKEISTEVNEKSEEMPITSYTVTSTDLKNYKRTHEYEAGRKNPFGAVEEEKKQEENNQGENNQSEGGTQSQSTSQGTNKPQDNSNQSYWPNKGTK